MTRRTRLVTALAAAALVLAPVAFTAEHPVTPTPPHDGAVHGPGVNEGPVPSAPPIPRPIPSPPEDPVSPEGAAVELGSWAAF